jgi:hypothetical protein
VFVGVRSKCTSNVTYQMTHVTLHSSNVPRHTFYNSPVKRYVEEVGESQWSAGSITLPAFKCSLLNVKTLTILLLYNQYPSLWFQEAFTLVASDMSC